jgi:hypothetical protein
MPARIIQQPRDHPISIPPVLVGQFDDVVSQTLFISEVLRHLALRRSMLTKRAAGAALRHAKRLPHMVDAFATT